MGFGPGTPLSTLQSCWSNILVSSLCRKLGSEDRRARAWEEGRMKLLSVLGQTHLSSITESHVQGTHGSTA